MKNPRVPLGISAVCLILAACGGGNGVAATVNGIDIPVSEVEAMRITEETAATINKAAFAEDLSNAILNMVYISAAKEEFSIEPTADEIAAKKAELAGQLEAAQGITVEALFAGQGLPIERFDEIANLQLIGEKLHVLFTAEAVPATDEDAQLILSGDPTLACLRHILVPTKQEAIDAKNRIAGGEEFAAVAAELGTDGTASSGGDLGCQALASYVAEFADAAAAAEVGIVTDPVESEFGWHLILVDPVLEKLKERIDAGRINQLLNDWLLGVINEAIVEVDDQFGVWVTEPNPMVQPPAN